MGAAGQMKEPGNKGVSQEGIEFMWTHKMSTWLWVLTCGPGGLAYGGAFQSLSCA